MSDAITLNNAYKHFGKGLPCDLEALDPPGL